MSNKKELNKESQFINIDSYVSRRKKDKFFSPRSIIWFTSILVLAIVLALLVVCLIIFFI